jgi:UDP-3-O-[3-hydroxymyristoyl] N-acetylglucosamine deacetylase
LAGLFSSEANYEIVSAENLPLEFDAFEDQPAGLAVNPYLRAVR